MSFILYYFTLWKACASKNVLSVKWSGFVWMQFVIPQIKKINAILINKYYLCILYEGNYRPVERIQDVTKGLL